MRSRSMRIGSSTRFFTSAAAHAAALVAAACVFSGVAVGRLHAQNGASERGAPALGSLLAGLGTTGRVLTIAAHPDDEDTQFITWLTRGRHVETAYLSLTRGDGGQNLIGNELGEALGVIRTQELMAARRIDGGRQYFTRAYDFGFSKNAEETYQNWPKDTILGDVVRVVRAFRPHVVVGFFSGTPRDGHGHHQVSGLLAREAYDAAGDTVRYPVREFGPAWTPSKFYRSSRQNPADATHAMNTGEYNPLLGRSYYEIAAESRSQHKSQGFGVLQRKGVIMGYVRREASRVNEAVPAKSETGIFDGVDTTWARLAARAATPVVRARIDSANGAMREARSMYRAEEPTPTVAPLARALALLRAARNGSGPQPQELLGAGGGMAVLPAMQASGTGTPRTPDADVWDALSLTIDRVERALVLAAGVAVEATAPKAVMPVREPVKRTVDDSLPVTITVFNRGRVPVSLLSARAQFGGVGGLGGLTVPSVSTTIAPDSALVVERFARAAASTAPWWRFGGRRGAAWFRTPIDSRDEAAQQARTMLSTRTTLQIADVPVDVVVPIVNRFADPVKGDQQVPVAAVPGITIGLENVMEYIRAGVPVERELRVQILSAYASVESVTVSVTLPKGLVADSVDRVRVLSPQAPTATLVFRLRGMLPPGRHELGAIALHQGVASTSGYLTVAYDHIVPQKLYGASGMYLSAVSVKLPPRVRVGYIAGVGDNGMDALRQLDVAVEPLDPASLGSGDLSRFSSIIVGPRAYEASDALVRNNARLLAYARNGGNLVVQYGQREMLRPGIMPYPITLSQPASRVTIETAPVRILRPDAPLLTTPNRLGPADWTDWVQERATYMPATAAPQYTPLLGMNDPDEPENVNGLLQAKVGRGTYTYVTLALFRQLPNGVPGAARLLLNLIAAPPAATASPRM